VALLVVVVVGTLTVSGCSLTTGSTGGSTGGATPTIGATATAKPKPSVVPTTDLAFCQRILSLAEANQLMSFPMPMTTIDVNNGSTGGTCNYVYTQGQHLFDPLAILFAPWTGPVPISQQDLLAAAQQLANLHGVTASTVTSSSGVGDQAVFIAASGTEVSGTAHVTINIQVFYVLYGRILFGCANVAYMGTLVPPSVDVASQSALQQCAQLVLSRL
jgi:hypothetical protein